MFERMAPEQHDTLDGVPEPSENPHLFGHGDIANLIAAAYRTGKLPHALLLAGPQGIGKATLAFHLAYHLLRNPTPAQAPEKLATPDPSSSLFRQIAMGSHPAILHLTRPQNDKTKTFKTVLTVDEVRKVNRFLSMTSHDGGYRVVIVDPADDMNTNAANALLKNLEEPPAKTLFVLITHSPGALLPTIRSRCQTIRLSPLDQDDLMQALAHAESPPPDNGEARHALAARAGGSARNAIILTQYGGLEIAEAIDGILAASRLDVASAYKLADAVAGKDRSIQFDIFNRRALELLSDMASAAARASQLEHAKRLSDTWQDASKAIFETETYNLDRKQHVLTMIDRLHAVMRM